MTDTTRKRARSAATARSIARNNRAARILGGITLDEEQAEKLADIEREQHTTAAAWVRLKIANEPTFSGPD